VLVFNLDTGAFKRGWGAYGTPLAQISNAPTPPHNPNGPPLREYRPAVHCVQIANDGLVYVCDRGGNRIQVFNKQGQFQKEFIVANNTRMRGSAGSVSFSPDPQQRFIYMSDIQNSAVWILERQTGKVVGRFGRRGYNGGEFMLLHIAVSDSRGNIYTGEVADSGRVQKFVPVR
jgi:DNA-binding beta-propeller fold protein YncE